MTSEWVWPATTTRSISRTSSAAPAAAMVRSETRLRVPYALFAPSRREAGISPRRPSRYSFIMTSEPMLPTSASPVATPIRKSHFSMGVPRTPSNSGISPAQRRDALDHFERGETGETGMIAGLVDERRDPNRP